MRRFAFVDQFERQGGGGFDRLQFEMRRDIAQRHQRGQPFVKSVISGNVGRHDLEDKIDLACESAEFHDLGHG